LGIAVFDQIDESDFNPVSEGRPKKALAVFTDSMATEAALI
jgi:hypothetical protein